MSEELELLKRRVRACAACRDLPLGPKPLFQVDPAARILVVGQAPGRITHANGRPFDDKSGVRLRDWLGVTEATFYDPASFAFLPMGLCYPGKGQGGDLPPRPECDQKWRPLLLEALSGVELTILVGAYAHAAHLKGERGATLGETVANWRTYWPRLLPLPHPSGRNTFWIRQRPWFERDVLPALRERVAAILAGSRSPE